MSEHNWKFLQLTAIREEEGDTLYALDAEGIVWTFYTGKTGNKTWTMIPTERVMP